MFQGMQMFMAFFMCLAGPSGYTIREVIKQTEADVKSWTDKLEDESMRPTRTFIIEVKRLDLPEGILSGFHYHDLSYERGSFPTLWLSVENRIISNNTS